MLETGTPESGLALLSASEVWAALFTFNGPDAPHRVRDAFPEDKADLIAEWNLLELDAELASSSARGIRRPLRVRGAVIGLRAFGLLSLPGADLVSVGAARRYVRDMARSWGLLSDAVDDLESVVSDRSCGSGCAWSRQGVRSELSTPSMRSPGPGTRPGWHCGPSLPRARSHGFCALDGRAGC